MQITTNSNDTTINHQPSTIRSKYCVAENEAAKCQIIYTKFINSNSAFYYNVQTFDIVYKTFQYYIGNPNASKGLIS